MDTTTLQSAVFQTYPTELFAPVLTSLSAGMEYKHIVVWVTCPANTDLGVEGHGEAAQGLRR